LPSRDAHRAQVDQARLRLDPDKLAKLDLDKLFKIVAMLSNPEIGERAAAAVIGTDLLEAAGLWWGDVVLALTLVAEARKADEANAALLAEIAALQAELEESRAENSRGVALSVWNDVGAKITSAQRCAQWVLDLHRQGRLHLTPDELDFLGKSVPRRHGPLSPNQRAWLEGILNRAVRRTGLVPPT
jgi:hypothetical protein